MTQFLGNGTARPFSTIFAEHQMFNSFNATVAQLSRDPRAQETIIRALVDMGQTRFIDLVTEPRQANIAMALHAGDGIVLKITPREFMATELFPYVIPPFRQIEVDCGSNTGRFVIENFPLEHTTETQGDVEIVRGHLQSFGLRFGEGDDKPANIAIMPNGERWILDGDAVDITSQGHYERYKEWRAKALARCRADIKDMHPDLYDGRFEHRQSPDTDFTCVARPSPIRAAEPQPAPPTPTAMQGLLRTFGIGTK